MNPNNTKHYQVDLAPFPVEALPANLRQLTEAAAANIQISPDLFAVPLLAALCIPLQSRFIVRIDSGYTEPLCLYTLTVARPSERKSAVISLLEKPFWKYQSSQNKNREITGDTPITLYVTDATPEKLAFLMKENGGAIALMSDEPDALTVAAGLRYGKGKNLGLMLQAWSAGRFMMSRATDDKRVSIDRAVMSVAVMSQPSYVESLVKDKEMSSRGFLQRFLFSRPLSKVGSRTFNKPDIPEVLLKEYESTIYELLNVETQGIPFEVELSVGAKNLAALYFTGLENEIEKEPVLEGWMGKLFGQVIRIAGILHCAQWLSESHKHMIDGQTMNSAIQLGNYFKSHAKAIFTDVDISEEIEDARELYRRMMESGMEVFTKSDCYKITRKNMPKVRLEAALAQLIKAQYIGVVDETADDRTRQYMLLGDVHGLDEADLY